MKRRHFLAAASVAPFFHGSGSSAQGYLNTTDLSVTARSVWESWKGAYMQTDGRVVDALQQGASHSEGQGYGALLATEFGDEMAFRQMVDWAEMNLSIRGDGLLAWRYLSNQPTPVPDLNNASDGDLFYAWALVRGSALFGDRRLLTRAITTAQALAEKCIVPSLANRDISVFIPGAQGFVSADRIVFNPSYIMPRAMREVASATGVVQLANAAQHAETMLAQLAERALVPDWVQITSNGMAGAEGFSTVAGYEAMRVPLYLIWSGQPRHPAVTRITRVYANSLNTGAPVPTKIDTVSEEVLEASIDPGYRSLAALVSCAAMSGQAGSSMPSFDPSQPYYPATLHMFAMIAANQVVPECVPI